jgi:transposase InsO family protein
VSAQCKILGVARSSYYAYTEPVIKDESALKDLITQIFVANRCAYGTRRIKICCQRQGLDISRKKISRIMLELGLVSVHCKLKYRRPKEKTPKSVCPNVIDRNFDRQPPRYAFVGDLTYVRVACSWNYVCLLLDLANREVVGYSSGARKDAQLVARAFASFHGNLRDVCIFHSDRGSENLNQTIDELLAAFGITRSLSRKSNPWDNAVAESMFKTFKKEFVYQEVFSTLTDLQVKLAGYVWWYNTCRLHSSLGYVAPKEYSACAL